LDILTVDFHFDRGRRSPYSKYVCDTPLQKKISTRINFPYMYLILSSWVHVPTSISPVLFYFTESREKLTNKNLTNW